MTDPIENRLVIGISTRALFNLDAENAIFERDGLEAYREYQRSHEDVVLEPGTAFGLIKALLAINGTAPEPLVEVILLSRNDADSSMRVFNSLDAHGIAITRGAFRGGRDPWPYLSAFHCDLFLSAEPAAVLAALDEGTSAALVLHPPETIEEPSDEVRIAFDGDAVLFDEESDLIYRNEGPEAFFKYEQEHEDTPLSPGPFRPFLEGLGRVQQRMTAGSVVRTALVTARNAPAHRRVVKTFRAWGVNVDEAYFLGGIDKTRILTKFRPHIFFDDSLTQLERAAREVASAHVPARSASRAEVDRTGDSDDQLDLFEAGHEKPVIADSARDTFAMPAKRARSKVTEKGERELPTDEPPSQAEAGSQAADESASVRGAPSPAPD
jgi:5'-nucleotidase